MRDAGAEATRPYQLLLVGVFAFHHSSKLLSGVVVLRLFKANLDETLGFSARMVTAPLTEHYVVYHHLVMRGVNFQELIRAEVFIVFDRVHLRTAVLADDFVAVDLHLPIAMHSFRHRLVAAGLTVLGPLFADGNFVLLHLLGNLLVLLFSCQSLSLRRWRSIRIVGLVVRWILIGLLLGWIFGRQLLDIEAIIEHFLMPIFIVECISKPPSLLGFSVKGVLFLDGGFSFVLLIQK